MVSVITPTCDRPVGLALAERWMRRQTVQPDEWIVVDGGVTPVVCTAGQRHLRRLGGVGAVNFVQNLLTGIAAAKGDVIIYAEDDDWYAPTHIAQMLALLAEPGVLLAGDPVQRYYNVQHRRYHVFQNKGASLCQTGMTRAALPWLDEVLRTCLAIPSYGVDGRLWVPVLCNTMRGILKPMQTVVGIKGIAGQAGLGVGHRAPIVAKWTADPALKQLHAWIGADAQVYAPFGHVPQRSQRQEVCA